MGLKVKKLKDYVQRQDGKVITLNDLHNVNQKMKITNTNEKSQKQLLMEELQKLCELYISKFLVIENLREVEIPQSDWLNLHCIKNGYDR